MWTAVRWRGESAQGIISFIYQLGMDQGNFMLKTIQRVGQEARVARRWRDGPSCEDQIKAEDT